jgi:hypothetical protein
MEGRYDNPIPTRFLSPIECEKIPALTLNYFYDASEVKNAIVWHCNGPGPDMLVLKKYLIPFDFLATATTKLAYFDPPRPPPPPAWGTG